MNSSNSSLGESTRLWSIARRILAPERSYTQEHVKAKLEVYIKVSTERAENGFNLMVQHGVLIPTYSEPPRYYLGDTTPF